MMVRNQRLPWKPSLFLMEKVRASLKITLLIIKNATSLSPSRIYDSDAFFILQSRKASESHKLSKFHSALGNSGIFPNPFTSSHLPWNLTLTLVDQIPGITLEEKVSRGAGGGEICIKSEMVTSFGLSLLLTLSTLILPM